MDQVKHEGLIQTMMECAAISVIVHCLGPPTSTVQLFREGLKERTRCIAHNS